MKLFFSTFLLLFCLNKTSASQPEEINNRFMPIFKQIVHFYDFLQDPMTSHYNLIDKSNKTERQKKIFRMKVTETVNANLKLAEDFLQDGEDVLYNRRKVENFLATMLVIRFNYLSIRDNNAMKTALGNDYTVPSDPHLASFYLKADDPIRLQVNKFAMESSTTKYQFLNLLCSSLYKIVPFEELSNDTINLIRSSPQLWPLFKGETNDLGHPDQASGFAIIKAYLGRRDLSQDNFERVANEINRKVYCQAWNTIKPSLDSELYKANLAPIFIKYKGLGCPKDDGFTAVYDMVFDRGEESLPLPYPDFLKQDFAKMKNGQQKSMTNEPSFFDLYPFEKLDVDEKSESLQFDNICTSNSSTSMSSQALLPVDHTIDDNIIIDENNNSINCKSEHTVNDLHSDKKTKNKTVMKKKTSKEARTFTELDETRRFHELMPNSPYTVQELTDTQQFTVNHIFDHRRFQTVTFNDFKKLWIQLGGTVKNNHGGSHYTLIGPKGKVIGGIFAHGEAHTYTNQTIKYLRAALLYVRCRPSSHADSSE